MVRYALNFVPSSDHSAPADPALVPCPACMDDRGEPSGDALVQLPSGTWVRQKCGSCRGLKKLDREGMARHRSLNDKDPEPATEYDDAAGGDRPTMTPSFDPAEFARASDAKLRVPDELRDHGSPDVREVATISGAQDALGLDAVPLLAVAPGALAWLDLGPEAMRLVACVNGVSSLAAVCAKASMSTDEGASLLLDLAEQGVVSFR
jgi:hypothetical protein